MLVEASPRPRPQTEKESLSHPKPANLALSMPYALYSPSGSKRLLYQHAGRIET